jgi:hypothetical protein
VPVLFNQSPLLTIPLSFFVGQIASMHGIDLE